MARLVVTEINVEGPKFLKIIKIISNGTISNQGVILKVLFSGTIALISCRLPYHNFLIKS